MVLNLFSFVMFLLFLVLVQNEVLGLVRSFGVLAMFVNSQGEYTDPFDTIIFSFLMPPFLKSSKSG